MIQTGTLILKRRDVAAVLSIDECITAVEQMFNLYAQQQLSPPGILGIHVLNGGFHIKTGLSAMESGYFVAKLNGNFPNNPTENQLPSIQGVVVLCNSSNGQVLAIMDSIEITITRTGAATAVAAKYLSRKNSTTAIICGCGNQGRISLHALMKVRQIQKVYAFDIDKSKASHFAVELSEQLQVPVQAVDDLENKIRDSDIVVTCSPAKEPFIRPEYIKAGTFIAAVGSDSENKQELYPELLSINKVVADLVDQCKNIGEVHHALDAKQMQLSDVYAELGEIVAGQKPGRTSDEEIIIFDSTGMALQDVAAAAIVYEKAINIGIGSRISFLE